MRKAKPSTTRITVAVDNLILKELRKIAKRNKTSLDRTARILLTYAVEKRMEVTR